MSRVTEQHDLAERLASTKAMLTEHGQEHLLTFAGDLEPEDLSSLLDQIDHLNVPVASRIVEEARSSKFESPPLSSIEPANFVPRHPSDEDAMRTAGQSLIEDGKVTAPVKGATFIGNGPDVLKRVTAVGHDLALDNGIGTCGKAGQGVPVGVGLPTLLVDSITVGGTQA